MGAVTYQGLMSEGRRRTTPAPVQRVAAGSRPDGRRARDGYVVGELGGEDSYAAGQLGKLRQRCKQSGMHWTVAGADSIIALRCAEASSQREATCRNQAPAA